jgi:RND family efflux transporter MFP subunit
MPLDSRIAKSSPRSWAEAAATFGGVQSDTKPSRDVTMRFTTPSEIREVLVSGGQVVKRGDLLIRARDAEINAALEQQRLRAASRYEIEADEAAFEFATFRFKNAETARQRDAFAEAEFEELRYNFRAATVKLAQSKLNHDQEQLRLKQAEGQAERFRLEAPFDGQIEQVMVDVGQGVTENMPALRIVDVSTLWIDAYAQTDETVRQNLKEGSPAWVIVNIANEAKLVEGHVLYVSPVADSVSQTRRVRVEIRNTESWPAGTVARVRFTPPDQNFASLMERASSPNSIADRGTTTTPEVSR